MKFSFVLPALVLIGISVHAQNQMQSISGYTEDNNPLRLSSDERKRLDKALQAEVSRAEKNELQNTEAVFKQVLIEQSERFPGNIYNRKKQLYTERGGESLFRDLKNLFSFDLGKKTEKTILPEIHMQTLQWKKNVDMHIAADMLKQLTELVRSDKIVLRAQEITIVFGRDFKIQADDNLERSKLTIQLQCIPANTELGTFDIQQQFDALKVIAGARQRMIEQIPRLAFNVDFDPEEFDTLQKYQTAHESFEVFMRDVTLIMINSKDLLNIHDFRNRIFSLTVKLNTSLSENESHWVLVQNEDYEFLNMVAMPNVGLQDSAIIMHQLLWADKRLAKVERDFVKARPAKQTSVRSTVVKPTVIVQEVDPALVSIRTSREGIVNSLHRQRIASGSEALSRIKKIAGFIGTSDNKIIKQLKKLSTLSERSRPLSNIQVQIENKENMDTAQLLENVSQVHRLLESDAWNFNSESVQIVFGDKFAIDFTDKFNSSQIKIQLQNRKYEKGSRVGFIQKYQFYLITSYLSVREKLSLLYPFIALNLAVDDQWMPQAEGDFAYYNALVNDLNQLPFILPAESRKLSKLNQQQQSVVSIQLMPTIGVDEKGSAKGPKAIGWKNISSTSINVVGFSGLSLNLLADPKAILVHTFLSALLDRNPSWELKE